MGLLPKNEIELKQIKGKCGKQCVLASLYEIDGYRRWDRYCLSDFPNGLVSIDDLKRFGIESKKH